MQAIESGVPALQLLVITARVQSTTVLQFRCLNYKRCTRFVGRGGMLRNEHFSSIRHLIKSTKYIHIFLSYSQHWIMEVYSFMDKFKKNCSERYLQLWVRNFNLHKREYEYTNNNRDNFNTFIKFYILFSYHFM